MVSRDAKTTTETALKPSNGSLPGMSMLKTSIELGNVGQFAAKPSRVPVPAGRRPSHTASRPRTKINHQHRIRPNGSAASLLDQMSTPSGSSSPNTLAGSQYTNLPPPLPTSSRGHGTRTNANRKAPYGGGQHAYTLSQSSFASQTISNHPLSAHMHLRSYEQLPGARSRSPYPVGSGAKGPRYRPASPAYSDSQASYPRPPYGPARSRGFRSPSPLSTYSRERTPPGWYPKSNHWAPRQPSAYSTRPVELDGQPPIDVAASNARNYTQSRGPQAYNVPPSHPLPGSWPDDAWTPTPPPPLFYDYSEGFQEQTYYRSFNTGSVALSTSDYPRQSPPNSTSMYHELGGDHPEPIATELPVSSTSPYSKSKQQSSGSKYSSSSSTSESKCTSESGPETTSSGPVEILSKPQSPISAPQNSPLLNDADTVPVSVDLASNHKISTTGYDILTSYKRSKEFLGRPSPTYPSKQSEQPDDKKDIIPTPVQSTNSNNHVSKALPESKGSVLPSAIQRISQESREISLATMERSSTLASNSRSNTGSPKEVAMKTPQDVIAPIIHAPVPERSVSSPGQKQRFSQILSLAETIEDPIPVAHVEGDEGKAPMRTRDQETSSTTSKIPRYLPSPRSSSKLQSATPFSAVMRSAHSTDTTIQANDPGAKIDGYAITPDIQQSEPTTVVTKDLPPLPHALSITSLTPSLYVDPSAIREGSINSNKRSHTQGFSIAEPPANVSCDDMKDLPPVPPLKFKLKNNVKRKSASSMSIGRPWNLEENYSWAQDLEKLHIEMPSGAEEKLDTLGEPSRFKLRGSKTLANISDTVKINKRVSGISQIRRFSGTNDLFRGAIIRRSRQPSGQTKSKRTSVHTRFVEGFDGPSPKVPSLSLDPVSPGLDIEVKSFFDDGSSQARPKSGLRSQLSGLRHKASGANALEVTKDNTQGLATITSKEVRPSRRSSMISLQSSHGAGRVRGVRSRFVRKIKGWVLKGEGRIHAWRARRRAKRAESALSKAA